MEFMIAKLLGFVMVLTRLSAFFLVVPVFSWQTIPARIKVAMAMLMTVFFSTLSPFSNISSEVSELEAILFLANEAAYGFALGLIVTLVFSAVKIGTRIIERQMGMAMAKILDPLTGESANPLSMFLEMVFILMFLAVNGHHFLLLIIGRSFEVFPPGSIPTIQTLTNGVIEAGSAMLMASLRLAAPMLGAFLVLVVTLGLLARLSPEMNILFISFPLRIGLGLFMTGIFLPFVSSFLNEFSDWMGKLLPL